MLHHVSLPVADLERSARLYESALGQLGYRIVSRGHSFVAFGTEPGKDKFAIKQSATLSTTAHPTGFEGHLAFSAPSRAAVDSFHQTAVEKGATNNGDAGLRPQYGTHYYAGFIIDFDGHQIEAVFNETP